MPHDRSVYSEHRRKQFMRPDAHRFIRPDAYRFMPPGSPRYHGKDVVHYFWPDADTNQPQEVAGRKDGHYQNAPAQEDLDAELERERRALRHEIAKLRLDWELFKFALKGQKAFNPNQPRVPAANPDGGQWTEDESIELGAQRRRGGIGRHLWGLTAQQFVARYCRGGINREMPGQFEDMTIKDIIDLAKGGDSAARKCYKLLNEPRFRRK
jgi:hypothetical protein